MQPLGAFFHGREVRQNELRRNHFNVPHRVDRASHVVNIRTLETAHDLDDRVDFADVAQELIAESLSFARSLHQSRNIDEFDRCRNDFLRFRERRQLLEALVRNIHDADVRLDRAEGEIGCVSLAGAGDRVEESGLADIGQSDDSCFEHKAGKAIALRGRGKCEGCSATLIGCVILRR